MFCPKCGTSLPNAARFCPTCGDAVGSNAPSTLESPLETSDANKPAYDASNPCAQNQENVGDVADVPDYLILNILATLFCCLPFGVAGIIFSVQANSAKARGDLQGAVRASSTAKTFLILGAVCGALLLLLSLFSFIAEPADATRSVDTYL